MKIVFLGTKGEIEENPPGHERYSSFYIECQGKRLLVEFGEDKTEEDLLHVKPDWIIISHAHPDHAFGLLNVHPDVPVYMSAKSLAVMSKKKGFDPKGVETFQRNLRGPLRLDNVFKVEVYPIEHSTRAPAVAMKIYCEGKTIFYSGDIAYDPMIIDHLKDVDLYIGDGSYLKVGNIRKEDDHLIGHAPIRTQLGWLKKAGVKQAIFTHFGKWVMDADLKSICADLTKEFGITVHAARDGRVFSDEDLKLEILPGLYLVSPHAEMIWSGKKDLIVKTTKPPEEYMNKPVYYMEDQRVYGILKITKVHGPFTASKVREKLRHRHQISDEEWSAWAKKYPSWNDKVYCWEFEIVENFKEPKRFEPAPGTQVWIKEVELAKLEKQPDFATISEKEFTKYVRELSDEALLHWHAKVHAWWNRYEEGKNIKFKPEQIRMFHKVIQRELIRRGYHPVEHKLDFIDEDELAPVHGSGVEVSDKKLTWRDIIPKLKPFYFLRPAIFLVGGAVTRDKEGGTKGDIDWLINYSERIPERDKAIEFRIGRQFPGEIAKRFSFNYRVVGGPFTDYIPAYDFLAVPSHWKEVVRMEDLIAKLEEFYEEEFAARLITEEEAQRMALRAKQTDKIEDALQFVFPAKPVIGHEPGKRYTAESVADLFAEDEYPVYAEKKYDGNWMQLCKKGDEIRIYGISGRDITKALPGTVEEMKKWPIHSCIIVSDTERWTEDGEYIPREEVAGYIQSVMAGKEKPDDTGIVHNIFDCIYFYDPNLKKHDLNCQAGDIHKEDIDIRKKYLNLLPIKQSTGDAPSIKTHFNKAPYILCRNKKELLKAIKKCSNYTASEGCVIKRIPNSPYPLNGSNYTWAKYKKTADIHAIVLKVIPRKTPGVYGYRVGLRIPAGWKVTRKVKIGDKEYMDIGKTLNLKKKLKVGDIVVVNFEELFYYRDPETDERQVVVYVPNIVSWRPEQNVPDDAEEAIMIADKAGVLVKKTEKLSYARKQMEEIGLWK